MEVRNGSLAMKITNVVLDILIFIFGIILLIAIYNGIQVKLMGKDHADFFGYSIFEVQTGSMAKTINVGDWVIVKRTNEPELNDIVTYKKGNDFITHRIVEAYKGTYVTQGDANNTKDDPISQDQIVGKVVKILANFGTIKKTILNPFVLIALIITVYVIGYVLKKNKKDDTKGGKSKLKEKIDILLDNIIKKASIAINNIKKERELKEAKSVVPKVVPAPETPAPVTPAPITPEPVKSVTVEEHNDITPSEAKTDLDAIAAAPISDEDMDKTMYFRSVTVDKSELDHSYLDSVEEEIVQPVVEEVVEDIPEDESLIKHKLDLLNKKRKKCKNIIERVMFIKNEELEEIIQSLNKDEKYKTNEITIKDIFMKNYIDGKYYNYCGDINVEYNKTNMILKLDQVIDETAKKLIKDYKGSDTKYTEKVKKFANIFTVIMYLEQGNNLLADINSKRQLYRKKILKYFMTESIDEVFLKNMVEKIIKIQKLYSGVTEYTFKKLETSTFELQRIEISPRKKIYGVDLEHNIEFSKVYSDYIVDKTYDEGIIAEDKVLVLGNLLLIQIVRNMLDAEFKDKYVIYLPDSLYEKDNKLDKFFTLIDDEYAKNNIIILINYNVLTKNKKLIKGLRKLGYRFAITFDATSEIKAKDEGILYVADYLFIDKQITKTTNVTSSIPEDLRDNIINENVISKLENFGGE